MWVGQLSLVLILLCVAAVVKSSVVLVNRDLAVEWGPDDVNKHTCKVYHTSQIAQDQKVRHVTKAMLHENVQQCWSKHVVRRDPSLVVTLRSKIMGLTSVDNKFIYPGTNWCGPGDRAKSYSDLGKLKRLDICCRAHDHCPDNLLAGESGYGLNNTALVTLTSCGCDDDFRQCLENINTVNSKAIGTIFFDIVHEKCFRIKNGKGTLEYPEPFFGRILSHEKDKLEHTEEKLKNKGKSLLTKIKHVFTNPKWLHKVNKPFSAAGRILSHEKEKMEHTEETLKNKGKSLLTKIKHVFTKPKWLHI